MDCLGVRRQKGLKSTCIGYSKPFCVCGRTPGITYIPHGPVTLFCVIWSPQPIHARSMLPCQDTPAIKTTFSAEVSKKGTPSRKDCLLPQSVPAILEAQCMVLPSLAYYTLSPLCGVSIA